MHITSQLIIACTSDTQNVLAMIQEFECKCTEYEQWLNDANKVLEDCGPIGADIDRLQVQEVILEVSRRIILFFCNNYEYSYMFI